MARLRHSRVTATRLRRRVHDDAPVTNRQAANVAGSQCGQSGKLPIRPAGGPSNREPAESPSGATFWSRDSMAAAVRQSPAAPAHTPRPSTDAYLEYPITVSQIRHLAALHWHAGFPGHERRQRQIQLQARGAPARPRNVASGSPRFDGVRGDDSRTILDRARRRPAWALTSSLRQRSRHRS